jgi:uncharacterized membrane protein
MNQRSFNSALLFGVTAGLRSMTAPALLALAQQQPGKQRHWLMADRRVARALTTMAVGELVFDKLPFAPNRIAPAGLSARMLIGAMCGAAASRDDEKAGALVGMAGALVSSFVGYALRKGIGRASRVPDALVALAEDGVAIAIGMTAAAGMNGEEEAIHFREPTAHVA